MSPGIGHRAMLLASGHIDGLISPADEPPHVIRGTAAKDSYVASSDTNEDDNGNVTTPHGHLGEAQAGDSGLGRPREHHEPGITVEPSNARIRLV